MGKQLAVKLVLAGALAAGTAVWAIKPRSFSDKQRHFVPSVPDVWYAHRGLHDAGSGLRRSMRRTAASMWRWRVAAHCARDTGPLTSAARSAREFAGCVRRRL